MYQERVANTMYDNGKREREKDKTKGERDNEGERGCGSLIGDVS